MTSKEKLYGSIVKDKVYIIKQFDNLGINKHYIGYFMLVDLVSILLKTDEKVESFSKNIYPIVAKKFNKTECTIERNIRNLIDKCWAKTLCDKLDFDAFDRKPTCREFILKIKFFIEESLL